MRKFGSILKEIRTLKGLTQAQLSAALNVNQSAIANWEADNRTPDIYTLRNIANFFDCSIDTLMDNSSIKCEIIQPSERILLSHFRELNEEGQEKLIDTADDLVKTGKYKKSSENELDKRKA